MVFFFFFFGFLTFWLCDSVFVTLSLVLYYIDKRDRERVEFVKIREYISVVVRAGNKVIGLNLT